MSYSKDKKQDIDAQNETKQRLVENLSEGVITLNENCEIIQCNQQFAKMIKTNVLDILGHSLFGFFPVSEHKSLKTLCAESQRQPAKRKVKLKQKKNPVKTILLSCSKRAHDDLHALSIVVTDITELEKERATLQKLAHFDSLTQLPNRFFFEMMLAKILSSSAKHKKMVALFFIDVDYFKNINDLFGHGIGDLLLKEISIRLKTLVRSHDLIARIGGDEFTIIVQNFCNLSTIEYIANRLIEEFNLPFIMEKYEGTSTLSIGISIFPSEGTTEETTMQNADQALYQAKKYGRNCYKFYNHTMQRQLERYMLIVNQLEHAIKQNQLELVYQPKIDIQKKTIVGIEALLRWNNPIVGEILPSEFIPVAEDTGLINKIGKWVIANALNQYIEWYKTSDKMINIKISINISANQLDDRMINDTLKSILNTMGVPGENILFELTETAVMKKSLASKTVLNRVLMKLGIGISIDDFGTGYSSLTYLKQLPIKELKIDKSFIDDIGKDKNNEVIIIAIINLASVLNLAVVAEGVETKEQLDFLTQNQCHIIQGFYFSKPLSPSDMMTYLTHF